MWQMMIPTLVGGATNVMSARSQMRTTEKTGEINMKLAKMKADAIRRNAKARLAAGADTAQEIQRQARVSESDAIQAMAAGGTVTDPEMLARLKVRHDQNSVAAILQGSREYYGMLDQAAGVETGQRLENIGQKAGAQMQYYGAISNMMLDSTSAAMKYGSFGKKKSGYSGSPTHHTR